MGDRTLDSAHASDTIDPPRVHAVDVAKYEIWRAAKDLDDVIYAMEARDRIVPTSFYKLRRSLRALARTHGVKAIGH